MITFIFLFCILLYALIKYNKGYEEKGAFIYFFFITNGFYMIPDFFLDNLPINKVTDFGNFYLIYVIITKLSKYKNINKYFYDKAIKACEFLFIYLTLNFLWTIIFGQEIFYYSLSTYRTLLFFLSFFLFLDMNINQCSWVINKIVIITIFATILFVLQPVIGVQLLYGQGSLGDFTGVDKIIRYRNMPMSTIFLLIYSTIRFKSSSFLSILCLFLSVISILMTQFRGIFIAYIAVIILQMIIEHKIKNSLKYIIVGLLLFSLFGSFVFERFQQSDTASDVKNVLTLNYNNIDYQNNNDGNFSFRILLLSERFYYLMQHPSYLFQGVGMRHDDSPKTNSDFDFYLGTETYKNGVIYKNYTSSVDISWMTPLFRFGLIGLTLYLIVVISIIKDFNSYRKEHTLNKIAFYFYIMLIISSLSFDYLFSAIPMFVMFLCLRFANCNHKKLLTQN